MLFAMLIITNHFDPLWYAFRIIQQIDIQFGRHNFLKRTYYLRKNNVCEK